MTFLAVGVVHEPPSTCRFRCVGVAFAAAAEGCPANKLSCVVAFVRGLSTADAALHCGVLGAYAAFAGGFARAAFGVEVHFVGKSGCSAMQ